MLTSGITTIATFFGALAFFQMDFLTPAIATLAVGGFVVYITIPRQYR
jgi:hypothetical protein